MTNREKLIKELIEETDAALHLLTCSCCVYQDATDTCRYTIGTCEDGVREWLKSEAKEEKTCQTT